MKWEQYEFLSPAQKTAYHEGMSAGQQLENTRHNPYTEKSLRHAWLAGRRVGLEIARQNESHEAVPAWGGGMIEPY